MDHPDYIDLAVASAAKRSTFPCWCSPRPDMSERIERLRAAWAARWRQSWPARGLFPRHSALLMRPECPPLLLIIALD